MTKSALFLSPHLDDVAFSCGGTTIRLISEEWDVALCTIFTASHPNPRGFALACQLDKGLPANVDYMALRRQEDSNFASAANIKICEHLSYPEAPHRGYNSAADLFAGIHEDDQIWQPLAVEIALQAKHFEWIFAPQGLGNHVDHLQTILAVKAAGLSDRTLWYLDTPYAIRNPEARPAVVLPTHLEAEQFAIDLQLKVKACTVYKTQVPFQFGSIPLLEKKLERFHRSRSGYSEIFLRSTSANTSPLQSRTMTRGI